MSIHILGVTGSANSNLSVVFSYARGSQHFAGSSLSCSQEASLVPILSQIDLVYTTASHFSQIHFIIILPSMQNIRIDHFPAGFPTKLYMPFASPHACYIPCHLIVLDLIIMLRSSSLRSFLQHVIISSVFDPDIYLHVTSSRPVLGPIQLHPVVTGGSFPGVKRPGPEADHSHSPNVYME
jgi:hypothetical protein